MGRLKALLGMECSPPMGVATAILLLINIFAYFVVSPFFGVLNLHFLDGTTVFTSVLLGGFLHGSLSHIAGNFCFLIPLMLVVEKKMGPIHLIALYLLCTLGGGFAQYHMLAAGGIGSSTVLFGLAPVAVLLLTKDVSRIVLLPFLVLMALECARWWFMDGVGHVAHIGGGMTGLLYYLMFHKE